MLTVFNQQNEIEDIEFRMDDYNTIIIYEVIKIMFIIGIMLIDENIEYDYIE
jgi:hypothetical protein